MKKITAFAFVLGLLLFANDSVLLAQRGGGGRGGGGGFGGGGAVQSYGGGGAAARSTTSVVGPAGGVGQAGTGGGSYTTKGGSTIDYKGAAVGGTTPGGVSGGKYVGGIQVATPGGKEVTHAGTGGAAVGPGGNAVAGKSGVTVGSGPGGSFATASRSGAALGSYGAVAGKTTVAAGPRGTYYRSTAAIHGQAVTIRVGVAAYPCFRPAWYAQYPGAWFAAGWTASAIWRAATWPAYVSYGYPEEPIYYDYGTNVVYQDDGVYIDGQKVYSAEEYAQRATALADEGRTAKATKEEEWLPLGVFAMVQGEETNSNHIFQLSINKQGVIRGNYYDAVTDATALVFGFADKTTERAAWTVGDRKTPVYDVGLANLTRDETTMLVHYSPERTQQFTLVRIESPEEGAK